MANEESTAAPKKGKKGMTLWLLLVVFALAGGASMPYILGNQSRDHNQTKKKSDHAPKNKRVAIAFDNIVVNIGDERLNRYLRVKLLVAVEEADVREVTELIAKQKPFLKTWLFGYLSDLSIQDVTRKTGVNKIRREICDYFNQTLFQDDQEKIVDILFDEFNLS
jgi:flagellar basal body-associated protein FliL